MRSRTMRLLAPHRPVAVAVAEIEDPDAPGAFETGEGFTEALSSGSGLRRPVVLGNDYLLFRTEQRSPIAGDRLHWCGPYTAEAGGTIARLFVGVRGGGAPQALRPQIYADSGSSDSLPQSSSAVGRPTTLLAVGDPITVAPGSAARWEALTFSSPPSVAAGSMFWVGVWAGAAASGQEASFVRSDQTRRHHRHAAAPYSATGSPPASLGGATISISGGIELSIYAVITPAVATGAMSLAAAAQSDRSVLLTLANVPPAATGVRLERSKNGAAFETLAHIPPSLAAFADVDKEGGATYQYRATPLLRNGAGAGVLSATVMATGARRGYRAARYTLTSDPVWNPMRGLVNWGANGGGAYRLFAASGTESFTDYDRTGVTWRALEPNRDDYRRAPIEAVLARAANSGRRAGFRWRAMLGEGNNCPDYIAGDPALSVTSSNGTEPRWNDDAVRARIVALWRWLKAAYGAGRPGGIDPRIAFLDVGTLLRYGEWAGSWGGGLPNQATVTLVIDAAADAFPGLPLLINMPDDDLDAALYRAAEAHPAVGWKYDAFAGWGFNNITDAFLRLRGLRSERTRRHLRDPERLIFVEHKHPGNHKDPDTFELGVEEVAQLGIAGIHDTNLNNYDSISAEGKAAINLAFRRAGYILGIAQAVLPLRIAASGAFRLRLDWVNTGNRPPHEDRSVRVQLRPAAGGAPVWEAPSGINLRKLHPTEGSPYTYQDSFALGGVAPGEYRLCVTIPPLTTADVPLRLANTGERSGDHYVLGTVEVGL